MSLKQDFIYARNADIAGENIEVRVHENKSCTDEKVYETVGN